METLKEKFKHVIGKYDQVIFENDEYILKKNYYNNAINVENRISNQTIYILNAYNISMVLDILVMNDKGPGTEIVLPDNVADYILKVLESPSRCRDNLQTIVDIFEEMRFKNSGVDENDTRLFENAIKSKLYDEYGMGIAPEAPIGRNGGNAELYKYKKNNIRVIPKVHLENGRILTDNATRLDMTCSKIKINSHTYSEGNREKMIVPRRYEKYYERMLYDVSIVEAIRRALPDKPDSDKLYVRKGNFSFKFKNGDIKYPISAFYDCWDYDKYPVRYKHIWYNATSTHIPGLFVIEQLYFEKPDKNFDGDERYCTTIDRGDGVAFVQWLREGDVEDLSPQELSEIKDKNFIDELPGCRCRASLLI